MNVLTEMTISINNKKNGLSFTLKTLNIRFIRILCSLFSYRKSNEKELLIKKIVFLFAKSLLYIDWSPVCDFFLSTFLLGPLHNKTFC
jgi:hypothetical protein